MILVALLLVLSVSFAEDPPTLPLAPLAPEETALVRVAQLAPGEAALDLYLAGDVAVNGHFQELDYGTVTAYQRLPEGSYELRLVEADEEIIVAAEAFHFIAGYLYTIIVSGPLPEAQGFHISSHQDVLPLFDVSVAGLRVVHASTMLPALDVLVRDEDDLARELDFAQASDYLAFAPGRHAVELRAAGTEELFIVAEVELAAGLFHTLFVAGEDDLFFSQEAPTPPSD
jgi:hypothetical protein